ncbi:MAG: phosphodiester glycosidase family protein, partial [Chloroflexia bacterium]|nr:phosphodiester glycosidase family protein [Chloroflexia bacterium]
VAVGDGWLSGRHLTSALVRTASALAGVNGDLFSVDNGVPQGLTMVNGQVLIAPKHRATFAWSPTEGPFIGYFTREWIWQAEVRAPSGAQAPVTVLNTRCPSGQICLFNEFARVIAGREGEVRVVLSLTGLVERIVRGERVNIQPGQLVLAGNGDSVRWLLEHAVVGRPLRISINTDPPLDSFSEAISGGPIILRDSVFVQDCLCALRDCSATQEPTAQLMCEDFSTDWKLRHYFDVRMPRTAIGFDRERTTLIVAVVDGYQRGYSRGITQRELADLLLEFGADTAMELDGGGSSTMVVGDRLVNRPPDETGERYVANALLFFWRE